MMYRIGAYLKFLFCSTNQHGVHSPFVYQYLTKCLYRNSDHKGNRVYKVLIKSISYLGLQSVLLRTDTQDLKKQLSNAYPALRYESATTDLIVVGRDQLLAINARWLNDHSHDKSMILLEDIHQNRITSAIWQSLCEKAWVSVSIDFYFGGILFLRKEQVKQHFRIRI